MRARCPLDQGRRPTRPPLGALPRPPRRRRRTPPPPPAPPRGRRRRCHGARRAAGQPPLPQLGVYGPEPKHGRGAAKQTHIHTYTRTNTNNTKKNPPKPQTRWPTAPTGGRWTACGRSWRGRGRARCGGRTGGRRLVLVVVGWTGLGRQAKPLSSIIRTREWAATTLSMCRGAGPAVLVPSLYVGCPSCCRRRRGARASQDRGSAVEGVARRLRLHNWPPRGARGAAAREPPPRPGRERRPAAAALDLWRGSKPGRDAVMRGTPASVIAFGRDGLGAAARPPPPRSSSHPTEDEA
jgi:hypothetical protein